ELNRLGLRYRNGSQIKRTGLAWLLKNPFYIGLIHIKTTNETFQGIHEPLVNRPLFDRVQNILQRKSNTQAFKHDFLYRRRLTCKTCAYSLIGETHKHHVYYRCQTSTCPVTCVREEIVNQAVLGQMARLTFSKDEHAWFRHKLSQMRLHKVEEQETMVNSINLQIAQADDRLNRLTDAYIDRLIEKNIFEQRKSALLSERTDLKQLLAEWQTGKRNPADELLDFLERADAAFLAYKHGLMEERRDLLDAVTS